jgi:gas vesicle protein
MSIQSDMDEIQTSVDETQMTFADALRFIPEYDGQPCNLYLFFNKCELSLGRVKTSIKPILLQAIVAKLSSRALDVVKYRDIKEWGELKFMLEESFGNKKIISFLQLQLNSCKQNRDEDVRSYSLRLEELQYKLISAINKSETDCKTIADSIKSLSLTIFLEGLNESIKNIVKSRKNDSLAETVQNAIEEERTTSFKTSTRNLNFSSNFDKSCHFCGKKGHISRDCRNRNRSFSQSSSNNSNNNHSSNCVPPLQTYFNL